MVTKNCRKIDINNSVLDALDTIRQREGLRNYSEAIRFLFQMTNGNMDEEKLKQEFIALTIKERKEIEQKRIEAVRKARKEATERAVFGSNELKIFIPRRMEKNGGFNDDM
jgi:metal-responsive CopG/Arc/MetJ family transcriptional regulator